MIKGFLTISLLISISFVAEPVAAAEIQQQWATPDRVRDYLQEEAQAPDVSFRLQKIGVSRQQRDLLLASFGRPAAPGILLICGQHGDEFDSVQACLYLIDDLQHLARSDYAWQARLKKMQLHILPLLNPDGLAKGQRNNADNVNLNRNWAYQWQTGLPADAQSKVLSPGSVDYRGPTAFSEPETQALRDWILKQRNLAFALDYHTGTASFAQGMVLYPFTYALSDRLSTDQRQVLEPLAREQGRLLSVSGEREPFVVLQTHEITAYLQAAMTRQVPEAYLSQALAQIPSNTQAPGSAIDWILGQAGIPALAFEVSRPFADLKPDKIAEFNQLYTRLGPALQTALAALMDHLLQQQSL
jgi:hypothetical protein